MAKKGSEASLESKRKRGRPKKLSSAPRPGVASLPSSSHSSGGAKRGRRPRPSPQPCVDLTDQRDRLTGALTHESFRGLLQNRIFEAARSGESVCLLLLDLDDFSELQSVHGRDFGDAALQHFFQRLERFDAAPIGRLGGDCFATIWAGEPEAIFVRAEDLRKSLSARPVSIGRGLARRAEKLSVSIAIAGYPRHGFDSREVFAQALAAMRRAKRLGKDRVALPPEESMSAKTSHFLPSQLEALRELSARCGRSEAEILREALDEWILLNKSRP